MKTTTAALALLLLAGTSGPALAQDKDNAELRAQALGDPEPRARTGGGFRGSSGQPPREVRPAPRPPSPPQAVTPREAPTPPEASGERRPRIERGGGRRGGGVRPLDLDGDDINTGLSPGDLTDREDRDELREGRRWIGRGVTGQPAGGDRRPEAGGRPRDRDGDGRPDGRRRDGDRDGRGRDGDRDGRDGRDGRGDGDRRWDGDRDGRRWDGDRDGRRWDGRGPPRDHPRWDGRRYPRTYNSRHRYRGHFWSPPSGFYIRLWSFGDVLPRAWYEPSYRLIDWWAYDLPVPPIGYVWVRVGDDALLVDEFSGRVIQVVRYVFW